MPIIKISTIFVLNVRTNVEIIKFFLSKLSKKLITTVLDFCLPIFNFYLEVLIKYLFLFNNFYIIFKKSYRFLLNLPYKN